MTIKPKYSLFALFLAGFLTLTLDLRSLRSQMMDFGSTYNSLGMVNFSQLMLDTMINQPPSTTPTAPSPNLSFSYRPDSQISAQVRQQFADQLIQVAKANQIQAKQMRQGVDESFTPANLNRLAEGLFGKEKFSSTDMVDATAMLVIGCFFVVQGIEQGTLEQNLGVRNQFQIAFSRTPAIASLSDAQKQRHTEGSLILLAILFNEYQQLQQGKPGYTAEGVKNFASALLRTINLDPTQYRLGKQGLERQP